MRRGTIEDLKGSYGSGIAHLSIKDSKTGKAIDVPCDNAVTVRMLAHFYGNVIGEGHTVNTDMLKGKEVYWQFDDMGLILEGLTPVETAPEEWEEDWLSFCKRNKKNNEENFEVTGL